MSTLGPTGAHKILQVHPTRRCNLRCLHCYSSSGPDEGERLDLELLRGAVADAAREGYTVLSVSGGEPLLYRPLGALLEHARAHGLATTVTTNGTLLGARQLELLRGRVDLLAISLDGAPASHDRMRGAAGAFERLRRHLGGVRAAGIAFGFIFTLTQRNLGELAWVAEFAAAEGASLLQVHPLEGVGRAQAQLRPELPDALEASYAYLEVARLRAAVGDTLRLHIDLAYRGGLLEHPERVFVGEALGHPEGRGLAAYVSPLVVEPDGTVVPLRYGFSRAHALGNLHNRPLVDLAEAWRQTRLGQFGELCRRALEGLKGPAAPPFVNLYDVLANA